MNNELDLPDLWPRIVAAHQTRRRRRRWLRGSAVGGAIVAFFAAAVFILPARHPQYAASGIDWQARAQALELQLDAIPLPASTDAMSQLAESELADLDRRLQTAYDNGAPARDVSVLWQRRSELLDALLSVHRTHNRPANI